MNMSFKNFNLDLTSEEQHASQSTNVYSKSKNTHPVYSYKSMHTSTHSVNSYKSTQASTYSVDTYPSAPLKMSSYMSDLNQMPPTPKLESQEWRSGKDLNQIPQPPKLESGAWPSGKDPKVSIPEPSLTTSYSTRFRKEDLELPPSPQLTLDYSTMFYAAASTASDRNPAASSRSTSGKENLQLEGNMNEVQNQIKSKDAKVSKRPWEMNYELPPSPKLMGKYNFSSSSNNWSKD